MEDTGLFNAEGKGLSVAEVMDILPATMINRVEVIDENGRSYVNWKPTNRIKLQVQDNERTLKVFVSVGDVKKYGYEKRFSDSTMGNLSSLLTKKQDKNMNEEPERQQDTDNHLLNKLLIGETPMLSGSYYLVRYCGGYYDDYYSTVVFVTNKKSTATKYCSKFNKALKKWKAYYEQFETNKYGMKWIAEEHVEKHFNRWHKLRNITKCYYEEIPFR